MAINVEVIQQQTTVEVASAGVQGATGAPGGSGAAVPFPISAAMFNNHTLLGLGLSNRCFYVRNIGASMTITKIGLHIGVSSGNISVGIYSPTAVDPSIALPGVRKVTSGAVACPAAGFQTVTIASTVCNNGDFLALSCDNATATFLAFTTGINSSNIFLGFGGYQESGHPLPTTPGSIDPNLNRAPVLKGLA